MTLICAVLDRDLRDRTGYQYDLSGPANVSSSWRYAAREPFYLSDATFARRMAWTPGPYNSDPEEPVHYGNGPCDASAIPWGETWREIFENARRPHSRNIATTSYGRSYPRDPTDWYGYVQARRIVDVGYAKGGGFLGWYEVRNRKNLDALIEPGGTNLITETIPNPLGGAPIVRHFYVHGTGIIESQMAATLGCLAICNSSGEDRVIGYASGKGGGTYATRMRVRSVSGFKNSIDDAGLESLYGAPSTLAGEYAAKVCEWAYGVLDALL